MFVVPLYSLCYIIVLLKKKEISRIISLLINIREKNFCCFLIRVSFLTFVKEKKSTSLDIARAIFVFTKTTFKTLFYTATEESTCCDTRLLLPRGDARLTPSWTQRERYVYSNRHFRIVAFSVSVLWDDESQLLFWEKPRGGLLLVLNAHFSLFPPF